MRIPRVTIGRLMVVVACLAFGLSALARPTRLGASMLSGSILSALTLSMVGVVIDRGGRRSFFAGFLIAGLCYLATDYWRNIDALFTVWSLPETATVVLDRIFIPKTPPSFGLGLSGTTTIQLSPGPQSSTGMGAPMPPPADPGLTGFDPTVFPRTVHMLLAWCAAITGGLVGRWLYATRKED